MEYKYRFGLESSIWSFTENLNYGFQIGKQVWMNQNVQI